MNLISIGKVSKLLGVTPKTIRIWEKCGKINVVYTPNGHRRYEDEYIINTLMRNEKILDKGKLH
jgi:DNA-binding transcriptional MerR regulator